MPNTARILVAQDEGGARGLQMRLQKLGYDVPRTVHSGEAAVEAAAELSPHLILMDVHLKGQMDGVEASARIRERFKTPVVFLTQGGIDILWERAALAAPYGVVLDPLNECELHFAIQVALQRNHAETELRKIQRWFAGTLGTIGDGIIGVDADQNIFFMNPLAQTMTGWSETEAKGRPLAEVFCLVDAATGRPLDGSVTRSLHDGKARVDAVLISRDGTRVPVEDNTSPVLDDRDQTAGGVLVFRNIAPLKQAEEATRDSEEQLRTLANSISHLTWMAEPDGSIFWYNQRWYEYTGTTPEEMQGWGWQSVHDPQVLPEVIRRWKESLEFGKPFDMEFPLRGAGGKFRWFLTRVTPVSDSTGRIVRWFGTNTDIHEARATREQLQRANAGLAQLAYSVSHDLREPLRNISIYCQLLNREYSRALGGQGAEFLTYITEGATRMESLVHDLLVYTESAELSDTQVESIDAGAALREALSGLRTAIAEHHAEITCGILPAVRVRAIHLRQLFQNLVENAIKYHSQSTPSIHVSAAAVGSEWIFSVKDNGIGVAPEYREKIFGLFRRLHRGTYSGTGLGLALCRSIVGLYGGRIWVDSEPGEGSTFSFALARREE